MKIEPDIMITDITLYGDINGIELIKTIKDRFPDVISIILTMHQETFYVERAIKAGARGYLTKNDAPEKLFDAIEKVMNGELYLEDDRSRLILDLMLKRNIEPASISIDSLSNREFEIFQFIGTGFSIKEIARRLNLSIYTIESHRRNIKKKLNIKTSPDLIKHAVHWTLNQEK
jgi:DNA-binding NarL/FixJ family response regulator